MRDKQLVCVPFTAHTMVLRTRREVRVVTQAYLEDTHAWGDADFAYQALCD
jgi:hypothetical protein